MLHEVQCRPVPDDGVLTSEDEQSRTIERRGWRVDRKGDVLVQTLQKVLVTSGRFRAKRAL
jgi:hypothetical protein